MLKFKYTTLAKPLGGNDLHSEASRYLMTDKTQLDIAFFYMVCTQLESDGGAKLTFLGKDRNLRIIIERLFSFFLKKFSTTRCILPILLEYTSEFRNELMKTAVPAYL